MLGNAADSQGKSLCGTSAPAENAWRALMKEEEGEERGFQAVGAPHYINNAWCVRKAPRLTSRQDHRTGTKVTEGDGALQGPDS